MLKRIKIYDLNNKKQGGKRLNDVTSSLVSAGASGNYIF